MKKLIIFIVIVAAIGTVVFFFVRKRSGKNNVQYTEIKAERGDLTEKALAVGKIMGVAVTTSEPRVAALHCQGGEGRAV